MAGSDQLYPIRTDDAHTQVPVKDLIAKLQPLFATTFIEQGLTPSFFWMVKVFLQLVIFHMGLTTTIKKKAHTPYADTLLVPAIEALLQGAPIIRDQEPRALVEVDLTVVKDKIAFTFFFCSSDRNGAEDIRCETTCSTSSTA